MKLVIFLFVVGVVWCASYRRSAQCKTSYDCTTTEPCCRDSNGHALTGQNEFGGGFGPVLEGTSLSGTCSPLLGGEGDVCDSSCGCKTGYKCYRPMSGVCCPPMRCYNATWVEQQQHYWANCHPPKCFLPP